MKAVETLRRTWVGPCIGAILAGHVALFAAPRAARAEWLTMDRAIQLAQTRSVQVVDASGQIGIAQAYGVGARISSFGNPYLELVAEWSRETGTAPSTSTRTPPSPGLAISGQLWLPLDIAGQRGARITEANQLMEWRKIGLLSARSQALGDVLDAYGLAVVSAARVAEAQRGEEAARSEVQAFTARLMAGDTTVYEVRLSEAELARWVQTRADAQLRLSMALNRLSQLTGVLPFDAPPPDADYKTPDLLQSWTQEAIAKVVDRAPIIAALRAEQQYWGASQERAERDKYPPLSFIVNAGRGDLAEPRFGGGLAWTFPVFRRNQGEIARMGAERSRAASLEATNRSVIEVRLRTAVQAFKTLRETLAYLEQTGLPATQQVLEAALESFRAGKSDVMRVLLARRDLATAHFRRLDLLEAMWRTYGELAAFGGGLP